MSDRRSLVTRLAVIAGVLLLVPFLPMPGLTTRVVAAAEITPLDPMRPATDDELAALESAIEEEHDHAHDDDLGPPEATGEDQLGDAHEDEQVRNELDGQGEHLDGEHLEEDETPGAPAPDTAAGGPGGSGDRLVGEHHGVDEFTMIGVALEESPQEPVLVRVREAGGGWGQWQELGVSPDEGPDLGSREVAPEGVETEPMWVGSADGYEVSVGADDAPGAEVVVVREKEQTVVAESSRAGAALPQLSGMRSRAEWGARPAKRTPSMGSTVKLSVVHHSDSSNSYSPGQVPSVIRGIQAYHMDGRGWDDIGYNFVVDRYGGIWEGRGGGADQPVVGAHAAGFNTNTVGVMVLGDFISAQPTAAAVASVGTVIGWKMALHGNAPTGTVSFTSGGSTRYPAGAVVNLPRVVGHTDVGSTACPGLVHAQLGAIRAQAANVYTVYRSLLSPEGKVESVVGGNGSVAVSGWAVDLSAPGPAQVRIGAGGAKATVATSISRPDVAAQYGGDGRAGFTRTLTGVPPGMQQVCATVWSALGHDNDRRLGCTWVLVGDPTGKSPVGRFLGVSTRPGAVDVSGWALDPETGVPVTTDLLVDGVVRSTVRADIIGPVVPAQYRWLGPARGFSASAIAVPAGSHTVCMRARNQASGVDTLVDCRTVTVPSHSPGGVLESVASTRPGKVDISGWALDLEYTAPVDVLLVVGGRWYVVPADRRRDDIAALYKGYGSAHGFAATLNAAGGPEDVCAYAINLGAGSNRLLGCRSVNVVK